MTDEELSNLIKWTSIPYEHTGGQTVGLPNCNTIGEIEDFGIKIQLSGRSHLKNKKDILKLIKIHLGL